MGLSGTEFRRGLILLSVIVIAYVSLTAYEIDSVTQVFRSGAQFFRNESTQYCNLSNSACSPGESKDSVEMEIQNDWWSDRNFTVISREFFLYLASQLRGTPYPGAKNYTNYIAAKTRLEPLPGVKALRPEFGPVLNDVTSFRYPINIQPCHQKDKARRNSNVSGLFVAVISAPDHFEKRNIIRRTWLRNLHNQSNRSSVSLTGHGFILGLTSDFEIQKRIKVESKKFKDILQIDMVDGYYNLTLKVVGLLNWLKGHCRVDFVLKVDDDVYVNVRNLMSAMKPLNPSEKSIYGSETDDNPQREGKWGISLENWPWKKYPIYVSGGAMIISGSTVSSLLAAAQTTPYFPFEDTYLSGLCTGKASIKVRCSPSMFVMFDETGAPKPCHVRTSVSWLTDSMEHFNKSHWATRDFYNNVTQCIVQGPYGENQTADPTQMIYFPFSK